MTGFCYYKDLIGNGALPGEGGATEVFALRAVSVPARSPSRPPSTSILWVALGAGRCLSDPDPLPAIDLKDGQAVRLLRGEMETATVFNDDPAAQARAFAEQGFSWLHLVDLNGAFEGRPVNAAAVEAILAAVDLPVQLGGGIRDLATIEHAGC